jgi:hypothetical protein
MKQLIKEKKVPCQYILAESLEKEFRQYVYKKHNGYRKRLFAQELELALTNLIKRDKR